MIQLFINSYEADIVGARNAGIDQVWLTSMFEQNENKATFWVKKLEEVLEIV